MSALLASVVRPLAYVSLPVFALHHLAHISPACRYYVRISLFLSTLGVCSVWGALCAVGMSLIGRKLDTSWVIARTFYALASRAVDIKLELEGEEYLENTKPAIIVGNHQSMLDILYIGRVMPKCASIMAKKELQWVPLLGQFMTLSGAVFVDRGNSARAIRSLAAAGETMKSRGSSIILFPEGTRSMREHNDLLPFKKGAFHTAVQSGIPIVPVVCENYWRLYRKGVFESGTLKVKVLPPIPTTGLTSADVTDLSIRVRELMLAALEEISTHPSPSSAPAAAEPSAPKAPVLPSAPSPSLPPSEIEKEVQKEKEEEKESKVEDLPPSPTRSRASASENGAETEEDDGMVLVGRPT